MMHWDKWMWILFFLIMMGIGGCVSGVVAFRWTATTQLNRWMCLGIWGILLFVFMSPFVLKCPPKWVSGNLCNILLYTAYFGFVVLFLFFCFLFVRDGLWLIGRILGAHLPSIMNPMAVLKANVGLLFIVILLSGYALWEGIRVPAVKEVRLLSEKVKAPLILVIMPDIHLSRMVARSKIQKMVKQVNELNPDVILLPGDIVDDEPELITDLVDELKKMKAPAYATDGNHELYNGREVAHQEFKKAGLKYLENEGLWIRPDIWIGGVPDIQAERLGSELDMKKAMPDKHGFSILLAHTPKMFDMTDNKADLQVSGHTHGGQIFPFQMLTLLSNRYLAGLYRQGGRMLYVSRGAGQWGPQMRLFAPSEITIIKIYPPETDLR